MTGASAKPTGPSQAEPEDVSALRASVPCAGTAKACREWAEWFQRSAKRCADDGLADGRNRIIPLAPYLCERLAHLLDDAAQAIETQRAKTEGLGPKDKSAVATSCARKGSQ